MSELFRPISRRVCRAIAGVYMGRRIKKKEPIKMSEAYIYIYMFVQV